MYICGYYRGEIEVWKMKGVGDILFQEIEEEDIWVLFLGRVYFGYREGGFKQEFFFLKFQDFVWFRGLEVCYCVVWYGGCGVVSL